MKPEEMPKEDRVNAIRFIQEVGEKGALVAAKAALEGGKDGQIKAEIDGEEVVISAMEVSNELYGRTPKGRREGANELFDDEE